MTEFRVGDRVMAWGVVKLLLSSGRCIVVFDGNEPEFCLEPAALTPDPAPPAEHGEEELRALMRDPRQRKEAAAFRELVPHLDRLQEIGRRLGWPFGQNLLRSTVEHLERAAPPATIPPDLAAALREWRDANLAANFQDRPRKQAAHSNLFNQICAADRAGILAPVEREASPKATVEDVLEAVRLMAKLSPRMVADCDREARPGTVTHLFRTALDAGVIR